MTIFLISQHDPRQPNVQQKLCMLDVASFINEMKDFWEDLTIYEPQDGRYALEWEIENQTQPNMRGKLHLDLLNVSFSRAPTEDVVDFIVWYRSYIPKTCSLFLFDDGLHFVKRLDRELSRQNIRDLVS